MNEPIAHGLTLREEGQVELLGETPNGLSATARISILPGSVNNETSCDSLLSVHSTDSDNKTRLM